MADAASAPVLVYDRVSANRRATRRLLTLFTLLVIPFIVALIPMLSPVIYFLVLLPALGGPAFAMLQATSEGALMTFAAVALITGIVIITVAIAVAALELWQATSFVLRFTHARPISHTDEPELWRTVENLSLAAGLPTPKVYVIESNVPNAFAVGLDPEHAAVVITRGLLELLDRRGLQGVIAHELSHIGNQDTRLNTVLAAILAVLQLPLAVLTRGRRNRTLLVKSCLLLSAVMAVIAAVSVLAVVAEIALAVWFFPSEVRAFLTAPTGDGIAEFILIGTMIFYGPLFMACPFYVLFGAQLCGRRVSGAVSRQREFLADGDAVLLTRDPEGLALALVTVGAASGTPMSFPRAAAHLFLVEPHAQESGWWDRRVESHPPIEERVAALGQLGTGIAPEAIETARAAGSRFRGQQPEEGSRQRVHRHSAADSRPPETTARDREATTAAGMDVPGIVSYLRLSQGPVPLLERPEADAAPALRLARGAVCVLLAVEGDFLRVQTADGATGYIGKDTAVTWVGG